MNGLLGLQSQNTAAVQILCTSPENAQHLSVEVRKWFCEEDLRLNLHHWEGELPALRLSLFYNETLGDSPVRLQDNILAREEGHGKVVSVGRGQICILNIANGLKSHIERDF